jgi:hypothetical protein
MNIAMGSRVVGEEKLIEGRALVLIARRFGYVNVGETNTISKLPCCKGADSPVYSFQELEVRRFCRHFADTVASGGRIKCCG